MNRQHVDILNLMAKLDGERSFSDDELAPLPRTEFADLEAAERAFARTRELRRAICIQDEVDQIPEAWIDRIQSFPSLPDESPETALPGLLTLLQSLRDSIFGHPQAWGAGFVSACALVLLISPITDESNLPEIGSGVGGLQQITEPAAGNIQTATNYNDEVTEAEIESVEGSSINLSDLEGQSAGPGLKGAALRPDSSEDDCEPSLKTDSSDSSASRQGNCVNDTSRRD